MVTSETAAPVVYVPVVEMQFSLRNVCAIIQ